ncbi:MAG: hypothetical protein KDH94_08950, partial [Coxiellaceae bacterium]|nr:hypothetical protein [Coxiellaceae bacterium]
HTSHRTFLKAVQKGIEQMASDVDQLFLCGFSFGALLSMVSVDVSEKIAGVIAVAPPIALNERYEWIIRFHKLVSWASERLRWGYIDKQMSHTRYYSHCCEFFKSVVKIKGMRHKINHEIPVFMVVSDDDETVQPQRVVADFHRNRHALSRMIYYSNRPFHLTDQRIDVRASAYPDQNIIDFSHICYLSSPDNPYHGRHGKYRDFVHYKNKEYEGCHDIVLGAASTKNLAHHTVQRLTYNPDFEAMAQTMNDFMRTVISATTVAESR